MQNQLFEAALGIPKPWYARGIDFDAARKVLTISIEFVAGTLAKTGPQWLHGEWEPVWGAGSGDDRKDPFLDQPPFETKSLRQQYWMAPWIS